MRRGEMREPIMTLVLTIVTCGFYYYYWMWVTTQDVNKGLGREEYNPGIELLLTFATCGLWVLVWEWRIGESIYELEQKWGVDPEMEPVLLFLTNFFGLGPLFYQRSLNNAWENGDPRGNPDRLEEQNREPQMPGQSSAEREPQGRHEPPAGFDGTVDDDPEGW